MRPLYLSMTAFGPYQGTETVDFTKFHSDIYLITGDTGAGKTTIFDGIMFALFGEASSKPSDRETEKGSVRDKTMFHCDFVSKSQKTEVLFRFESDGKKYQVVRTISYSKTRGQENVYGDPKFKAELTGDGIRPIEKSENVTEAIKQILNLDATQFRQIVMLAQGQFRAFMESHDTDRKEILGKIFDSSSYVRVMQLLKMAETKINSDVQNQNSRIMAALSPAAFPLTEEMTEEERARFSVNHPELLQNVEELIKEETLQEAQLRQEEKTLSDECQNLRDRKGIAEEHNRALDNLDAEHRHKVELEEKANEIREARTRLDRMEKAARKVYPKDAACAKSIHEYERAGREAENAEKELQQAREKKTEADEALQDKEKLEEERQRRNNEIGGIQQSLGRYDELEKASADRSAAKKKADENRTHAKTAETERCQAEAQIHTIETELEKLKDADETYEIAKETAQKAEAFYAQLDGPNGLLKKQKALAQACGDLHAAKSRYQSAHAEAERALERSRALQDALRSNRAGLLARELDLKLETADTAACPVCGGAVCRNDRHRFAVLPDNAPTEEETDAAKHTAEQKDAEDRHAGEAASAAQKDYENKAAEVSGLAEELLTDYGPWTEERLLDEALFAQIWEKKEAEKQAAQKTLESAAAGKARKKELEEELPSVREKKNAAERQAEMSQKEAKNAEENAEIFQNTIEKLTSELAYADRTSAEAAIREKQNAEKGVKAKIKFLDDCAQEAANKLAAAEATAQEKDRQLQSAEAEKCTAEDLFCKILAENGFASEMDYRAALPQCTEDLYESRIASLQKQINDYDNDVKNTGEQIRKQTEATKDYIREDVDALSRMLEKKEQEKGEHSEKLRTVSIHLQLHRNAKDTIVAAEQNQKKAAAALQRVRNLSIVANGSKDGSGKHAFDGYVLGQSFDEVLEQATGHLDTMSGGRYTLVHENSGRSKASAADFVIQILDKSTGLQREIGSISGGEGFQVSMALALGLSDVAQAHATGGKRIESLFVDEGFGTLDESALSNMLHALKNISGNNRLVGIISHVDALEEYIAQDDRLHIKKRPDGKGSCIEAQN